MTELSEATQALKATADMLRAEWRERAAASALAHEAEDRAFWEYRRADDLYWEAFNREMEELRP